MFRCNENFDIWIFNLRMRQMNKSRAVDTDSLNPDTDTDSAFQVNPNSIQIQGFDEQKTEENKYSRIFLNLFLLKNCNLLMY
jgi:hypothetical protein